MIAWQEATKGAPGPRTILLGRLKPAVSLMAGSCMTCSHCQGKPEESVKGTGRVQWFEGLGDRARADPQQLVRRQPSLRLRVRALKLESEELPKWEFPKIRGPKEYSSNNKDTPQKGSPIFGKPQVDSGRKSQRRSAEAGT